MTPVRSNFVRFWLASLVTLTGSFFTSAALPLIVISRLHGGVDDVALIVTAAQAPNLVFGLIAGPIVERLPARTLQALCDLLRCLLIALVPVASLCGFLSVSLLVWVSFAVGTLTLLFDVANNSYLVDITPPQALLKRNGLISGTFAGTASLGPLVAGVVFVLVTPEAGLLFDAATYLFSFAVFLTLPTRSAVSPEGWGTAVADVRAGARRLVRDGLLLRTTLAAVLVNLVAATQAVALPQVYAGRFHYSASLAAALIGSGALGGLVGGLSITSISDRVGSSVAGASSVALIAAGCLAEGLAIWAGQPVAVVAGALLVSSGTAAFATLARVFRQVSVPREELPRITALVRFASWGIVPLSAAGAGPLLTQLGLAHGVGVTSLAPILATVLLLRPMRHGRRDWHEAYLGSADG